MIILDQDGPGGEPFSLFESGAMLMYLADKCGKFLPPVDDVRNRYVTIQWLMFQMGGVGPMLGQLGYFWKFAGSEIEDPRPRERYVAEAKRLLAVIEGQLDGRDWIAGDYSIADIALAPWIRGLDFYGAKEIVGWDGHPRMIAWLDRFLERPAVQTGLVTPRRD